MRSVLRQLNGIVLKPKMNFSGFSGPYNPYLYKRTMAPRNFPTNKEIYNTVKDQDNQVVPPIRNMRHINPIRQSGPIPAFFGTYTMEDIKRYPDSHTSLQRDRHYCQMDADQIMRRVPGITRKEVDQILRLGLQPDEQLSYAYLAYTNGIDVFYEPNQVYISRQVLTNSKGQKVELYFLPNVYEHQELLQVGFAPVIENSDWHWEIFLWGETPLKVTGDLDLSVPNTFFEYECEWSNESVMTVDQMNLPESIRPYNTPRNPYCRKELWKSHEQLQMEQEMLNPEWKLPKTG